MSFAIDPSRVIPFTRVPVVRLPDDIASRLREALQPGGASVNIPLPKLDPAETSLGPAQTGNPGSDTDASQLRAEFKVDGKVIARIFNSGAAEFAGAYAHLQKAANFDATGDGRVGPELADARIATLTDLLKASPAGAASADAGSSPRLRYSDCVVTSAATALTQEQWLALKAQTPGSIIDTAA
jgi:hypothetical protein